MPRDQPSRVPWPGNSWMPFTFQPALRVLQQPHKRSHSLQLATDTEPEHRYIVNQQVYKCIAIISQLKVCCWDVISPVMLKLPRVQNRIRWREKTIYDCKVQLLAYNLTSHYLLLKKFTVVFKSSAVISNVGRWLFFLQKCCDKCWLWFYSIIHVSIFADKSELPPYLALHFMMKWTITMTIKLNGNWWALVWMTGLWQQEFSSTLHSLEPKAHTSMQVC